MIRQAARVGADLVVVRGPDLPAWRMWIFLVEVQGPRDAGGRACEYGEQREDLHETKTHVNPL